MKIFRDQTYTFRIDHIKEIMDVKEKQVENNSSNYTDDFYIQISVLYTHHDGSRRIRIINLCLPKAYQKGEYIRSINTECLILFYSKLLVHTYYKTNNLDNAYTLLYSFYYKNTLDEMLQIQNTMRKQLPQNLQKFPLYFLGLLKNRIAARDPKFMRSDIVEYFRYKVLKMGEDEMMTFLLPKIYDISGIVYNNDEILDFNGEIIYPQTLSNSMKSLLGGFYLIDNQNILIIHITNNSDKGFVESFFGFDPLKEIANKNTHLITEENIILNPQTMPEIKGKLSNLLEHIRGSKTIYQPLLFSFEGLPIENM
jgi:hypothetical protein